MGTPESQREWGPSWGDVKQWITDVSKAHNRPVRVKIEVIQPRTGPSVLYVAVVSYSRNKQGDEIPNTARGHQWPSGDWRTMPAMLLALIAQLDDALTDYETTAARQASF